MTDVAPYGTWASPVTAADVASEAGRPGWLGWACGDLWWTEPRPNEKGRVTLMRRRASPAAAQIWLAEICGGPSLARTRRGGSLSCGAGRRPRRPRSGLRRSVVARASPEREGAGHSHAAPGVARGG